MHNTVMLWVSERKSPRGTAIPGSTANTPEVLTMKSLAERLRDGEFVHCDGGWIYFDDPETGEEVSARCKCRRVDDVEMHATSLERLSEGLRKLNLWFADHPTAMRL